MLLGTKLIAHRTDDYWQKPLEYKSKDVKLLVKRTYITSDLGDSTLPQWAAWVKVVIDGGLFIVNGHRAAIKVKMFTLI